MGVGMIDLIVSSPPFSPPGCNPNSKGGQGVRKRYREGKMAVAAPEDTLGDSSAQLANLIFNSCLHLETIPVPDIEPTLWKGCYNDSWNGYITPDSFQHPAKYARGLIERIVQHALDEGWVKRGGSSGKETSLVLDPFRGSGMWRDRLRPEGDSVDRC